MNCRICGGVAASVLDLGIQPFANKYPKNQLEKEKEFKQPMIVQFCEVCRSAQIENVTNRGFMFEDYYYLSSVNKELVEHFKSFAESELQDYEFVLDIGSNDGILLRILKEKGIKCLGIDPSENVGALANAEGLETIVDFFNSSSADLISKNYGKPDAIVASSMFTHLEDPKSFLKDLQIICSPNTLIYIEVEYLGNLLKNLQFERFYFDRPHYYSIKGIKMLFENEGFKLLDLEEIDPHGGSIRLKFGVNDGNLIQNVRVLKALETESELLKINKLQDFSKDIINASDDFKSSLMELKKAGNKIAAYGCPARLATITNFCDVGTELIDFIAEDSPLKIDRFSPGMHIPIIDSKNLDDYKFDVLVVFAYEYAPTIIGKTKKYNVKYFSPIPFTELKGKNL